MKAFAGRCALAVALAATMAGAQITTSQYDNMRSGATLHEKALNPQNVNARQFGKLGAFRVDGAVYAQPLFLPSVEVPGKGIHDVIFVATEHDSVYAFDAYQPNDPPLWKVSFLDKARGTTPLSEDMVQCPFIRPEVGITSTPVIDPASNEVFAVADTLTVLVQGKLLAQGSPGEIRADRAVLEAYLGRRAEVGAVA